MKISLIRKKVAAVAVASLGFGLVAVISAAPASALDTACTATNLGIGDAGTVTGVTTTIGSVTRTGINTFTAPVSIAIVGTDIGVDDTVIITGTHTHTGGSTGVLSLGGPAECTATRNSATSATVTGTLTITAVTNTALANVAALAGGYVNTISADIDGTAVASAAVTTTIATASVTAGSLIAPTAGTGSTSSALVQQVNGQGTVRFITGTSDTSYTVTSSGVGTIVSATPTTTAVANLNGTTAAAGVSWSPVTTVQQLAVVTSATVAGTQTLTFQPIGDNGIPGTAITATITWGAAPVLSAALSTAFLGVGSQANVTANVAGGVKSILTAKTAFADAAASIEVITRNTAGASLLATQTLTVVVTGPGTVSIGTTNDQNSQGRALTGAAGNDLILVFGDGTSGTSTITISQGTTVISTKTVTFYGAVATLTAVQNHGIANSAGGALGSGAANAAGDDITTTPAVVITAKDVNGNAVPDLTITALSSDTTVMSNTITVNGVTATPGNYNVQVNSAAKASGSTATLTFRVMSGTTVLAATAPLTYTLGGGVSTVALSLDAASYDAGAPAVATLTLKDSSGNPVWDNDYAGILTAALTSSLLVTAALQFNAVATIVSSLGGVSTVKLNAPGTSASAWTISGTTGAGPGVDKAKALSASAAVTNASADAATDAANEATDAANAATDAALSAAEAADAATSAAQEASDAVAALSESVTQLIAGLQAQIQALVKVVNKIAKQTKK